MVVELAIGFLVLPLLGLLVAAIRIVGPFRRAMAAGYSGSTDSQGNRVSAKGSMMVALVLPATPVLFGSVLFMISLGKGPDDSAILLSLSSGFGLAGMGTAIGMGMVFAVGASQLPKHPYFFGRIVTLAVLPETNVIYALVISFLSLGKLGSGPLSSESVSALLTATRLSALYGILAVIQGLVVVLSKKEAMPMFRSCLFGMMAIEMGTVALLLGQFLLLPS